MAGSPCPVEVMKACVDRMHMVDVTICYGMTETSPVSTQTLPDDSLHHRTATVGRAHPHVEIRVADPVTGETLERGATGEFCTRGYSVMQGYWNDAGAHRRRHRRRRLDAHRRPRRDGRRRLRQHRRADQGHGHPGRRERLPREVEEFLYTHPDVEDVQVIGVPDERYGEELMAWVPVRPGAAGESTPRTLREYCRGRIAHFKIPRYVKFVDEFPMTVTGKVQKFKIRDEAIDELGLTTVRRRDRSSRPPDSRRAGRVSRREGGDLGGGVAELGEDVVGVLAQRRDGAGLLDLVVDVDRAGHGPERLLAVAGVMSTNAPDGDDLGVLERRSGPC